MPNSFCNLLSNGYSFTIDRASNSLQVGPCCFHKKKISVDAQVLQRHRDQFDSVKDWTLACENCRLLESSGQQSLRQTGKDWIPVHAPAQAAVMIDVNLDIECNAACVICNDRKSSLWQRENQKFFKINDAVNHCTQRIDTHIDTIVQTISFDHVTYIKFFGGEPLFTDTHIKFLERIPHKENVTVHYTTNGSIFPNEQVMEIWSKFKTIIFAASIDGIEQQFDYVRWPLPWTKVSQNLLRIKCARMHNVIFRIEFTANLLNTYYFDRLENWVEQNFKTNEFGDKTEINIHHCVDSEFALEYMPKSLRELIIQKYGTTHILSKMVSTARLSSDFSQFWLFVDRWDSRRNNDWRASFPELVPYIPHK